MLNVKLLDDTCAHEPLFYSTKNQDKIRIIKDEKVNEGDIVIYSNNFFHKTEPLAKRNIAYFCEPIEGQQHCYNWLKQNLDNFDIVLTWARELLEIHPEKCKVQLLGTTWIPESERNIHPKTKLASMIVSNKRQTSGHRLRHKIADHLIDQGNLNVDFFGGRFGNLPQPQAIGSETLYSIHHPSNRKIDALKNYMFTICILPCKVDYYFDEKLIDCFLTGTVPIFWGCPSIGKFFDTRGMLIFDTFEECIDLLKKINTETYYNMLPYIEENFEEAKKYAYFRFNEEEILNQSV